MYVDDRAKRQFSVNRDVGSRSLSSYYCMPQCLAHVKSLPTVGFSVHSNTSMVRLVRNRQQSICIKQTALVLLAQLPRE